MTELGYRPDQAIQYGPGLRIPDTIGQAVPAIRESAIQGADSQEVDQAIADAHQAIETHADRYVYTHDPEGRRLEFEIRHASPGPAVEGVNDETRFADDVHAAVRGERDAAAAQTPEALLDQEQLRAGMAAQTAWLVRVGRAGELDPDSIDPSLNEEM